jgi:hypothetical protein
MIREQIGAAINGANQRINNNTPSFDSDQMPNDDYVPPGTPVAAVAQPAPSKTPDEQRLENWLVEIGQLATEQSIMSFDRGAAWRTILARWLRDDPEKAKIARTALGERYHALTGKEPPAT